MEYDECHEYYECDKCHIDEPEWIIVDHNSKKYTRKQTSKQTSKQQVKPQVKPQVKLNLTFDDLKTIIVDVLKEYNPYAIYIYGSRARKTNKLDSDVDIMVIWRIIKYDLEEIFYMLREKLGIDVDFVNLLYTKNKSKIINNTDIEYYKNVIQDGINIFNNSDEKIYLEDVLMNSVKIDHKKN